MARKVIDVTVPLEGRDHGKVFKITEMSAMRAEKWATKVLLALSRGGLELPEDVKTAGIAGVAVAGINAISKVSFEDAEPILDEMLTCVQFVPDPKQPAIVRSLYETDVEEMGTILWLRQQILELHVGFSLADTLSTSEGSASSDDAAPATISSSVTSMFRRR